MEINKIVIVASSWFFLYYFNCPDIPHIQTAAFVKIVDSYPTSTCSVAFAAWRASFKISVFTVQNFSNLGLFSLQQSRWALICVLCRERVGACIQCSVKTCKTAYHVTCAFKHGLEMKAIIEDENADDGVKLRVCIDVCDVWLLSYIAMHCCS